MTYKRKTDDDSIERRNRRHAILERTRELEPRYDPQWFLGLSLVIIPDEWVDGGATLAKREKR